MAEARRSAAGGDDDTCDDGDDDDGDFDDDFDDDAARSPESFATLATAERLVLREDSESTDLASDCFRDSAASSKSHASDPPPPPAAPDPTCAQPCGCFLRC